MWQSICLPMQEMLETWVRSLGWEDPWEEEMTTNSSILAWRVPWTKEPGGLQATWLQRVGHTGLVGVQSLPPSSPTSLASLDSFLWLVK